MIDASYLSIVLLVVAISLCNSQQSKETDRIESQERGCPLRTNLVHMLDLVPDVTALQALGTTFISHDGVVTNAVFSGSAVVGVLFAAGWCEFCSVFTPKLIDYYASIRASCRGNFEVVFCSLDGSQLTFNQEFAAMPWLAIPFDDPRIGVLESLFNITMIPTLIFINGSDGTIINADGVSAVELDPHGNHFPFSPLIAEL